MSRPFAKYPAKPTFAQINEPIEAGEYIQNKKTKYTFCTPNICHPNKNVYSQSNLMALKRANNLAFNPCENSFNSAQLYSNLYSQLDLSGNIPVISDLSGNTYPVSISTTATPYLTYNIDPCGNLFGDTVCGINNYEQYIVYNPPCQDNK
jgi:hypothetical protein